MRTYPSTADGWISTIFDSEWSFVERALSVFTFQYQENKVYRSFVDALGIDATRVSSIHEIPLLPVEAFRDTILKTGRWVEPELVFQSSGTSNMARSRHEIFSAELYRQSILRGFQEFYAESIGDELVILGYTPGYANNPHSSLIWMINELIRQDTSGLSRFLPLNEPLDEHEIQRIIDSGKRLMLFGAAFGLLDLIDRKPVRLPKHTIVMETGGMKTYKREMTRAELHHRLANGFGIPEQDIHSEYGMAEMLSQAYNSGEDGFETPAWLKITICDPENPMKILPAGQEGLIGVMDLANVYSCSFLLTGDRGVMDNSGRFFVLGRWKTSNLRGCNFLIDQEM